MSKLALIFIAVFSCTLGCQYQASQLPTSHEPNPDSRQRMIKYLKNRRLPPLKAVQIWENNYGPGLKLTTRHYEVYTTLLEPLMLSQVPGFIESAYRAYQNQLPSPIPTKYKFTVYLFAERQQWEDFTKDFAGPRAPLYMKLKAGAYYLNGACVAYNIGRERTFSIIGHEGWHQFTRRHFRFRLPSWLDEGIAMLFESYKKEKGLFYFKPSRNLQRLGALRITLEKNNIIPLNQLLATNPGQVLLTSDDAVTAFYGQSYALIRFLREEGYGKRLGNYHQLILGGLKGTWPLDRNSKIIAADRNIPRTAQWNRTVSWLLFKQYISPDVQKIEDEYLTFCRKIVYHVRVE